MFINKVHAMLMQLERVSEVHFPTIWRSEFQKVFLRCPTWGYLKETVNCKKTESLGKSAVDKSAWIKARGFLFSYLFIYQSWTLYFVFLFTSHNIFVSIMENLQISISKMKCVLITPYRSGSNFFKSSCKIK